MKKILILISLIFLVSCGMTQQEKIKKIEDCKAIGLGYRYNSSYNEIMCTQNRKDSVMDCIEEYTRGLDEKYNNPDIVTNLREDNYSEVVKSCNKIFGEKELIENK